MHAVAEIEGVTMGQQIRNARNLLGWSMEELADRSMQAPLDIARIEASSSARALALPRLAVRYALEAAGVEFLNHGQPGVRLRKA